VKLHLLRHPEPLVEKGVCYGRSDLPCEPLAVQAAAQSLQERWKQWGEHTRVLCSPLQRCEHIAQYLSGRVPGFAYQIDARLCEMDFGEWEMQPWAEIPAAQLQAWTDDFAHYRCGSSGESAGVFVQRVAQRLWESLASGQDEVWITHAGVWRALLWLQRQQFSSQALTALATQPQLIPLHAAAWPQDAWLFGQWQTVAWPVSSMSQQTPQNEAKQQPHLLRPPEWSQR
jgi:alpha-ribazole phosphatase